MTCLGDEERIDRYLDGELSPSEQTRFKAHLRTCPACREALARRRALFALLDDLADVPVPVGLHDAVLSGLAPRRTPTPGRWLLTAQVVATLLLLALAWPTLRQGYALLAALLPPGWLSALAAQALLHLQTTWAWLEAALRVDVELALVPIPHLGLSWTQAALLTGALLGLWLLGNRLLLYASEQKRRELA